MRHLGYLQFGINSENAALNVLVHVLQILGLYPRANFLLDIIFECLLLSRNYESRLGTGIKSWKNPAPACKDLKTPWRTAVGWQILLAVRAMGDTALAWMNRQGREKGSSGKENFSVRWRSNWVLKGEALIGYQVEKAGEQPVEKQRQVRRQVKSSDSVQSNRVRWEVCGDSGWVSRGHIVEDPANHLRNTYIILNVLGSHRRCGDHRVMRSVHSGSSTEAGLERES